MIQPQFIIQFYDNLKFFKQYNKLDKFYLIIFNSKSILHLCLSMTKNPNFFENINDKMSQSMKLAYNQGGSDYQGRSGQQILKYANNKAQQFQGFDEKQVNQNIGIQLGTNARQIKTQYSQISHVENGFKKLKGNQVQMLKELRNEYDMLRNLQAKQHRKQKPKSISSSSNNRMNNREQSSQTSSISSSKKYRKQRQSDRDNTSGLNNRQQRLWMVQRKQYQMIVANCQQKLQEMVHAELEYKKIIHSLKASLNAQPKVSITPDNSQNQAQISSLKKKIVAQQNRYRSLQKELQKTRKQNKSLQQKILSYEGMLIGKDHDFSKYEDQVRRYEDSLRLERQKFHNIQIEKVKMMMQYQILEKQKSQQIMRLNKVIQQNDQHFQENKRIAIQRLEDLVQLKDERYQLLLSQYERLKKDVNQRQQIAPAQDNSNNNQIQGIMAIIQEYISQKNRCQSNDLQRLIMALRQMKNDQQIIPDRDDGEFDRIKLLMEIRILKQQIDKLKDMHAEDLQKYRDQVSRGFQSEIYGLKETIRTLQQKLKQKNEYIPSTNQYQPINTQVFNLKRKINQLQNLLRQKDSVIKQLDENWQKYKKLWQKSEDEVRRYKNQLDQAQFQIQKLMKQLDFRTNILKRQNQASIRLISEQLDNQRRNVAHWKNQFQNIKRFYQQKINQKNRLISTLENTTQITQIRKQYNLSLQNAKQEYQRQIKTLVQKLSMLSDNQRQLEDFRKRYNYLENSLGDIKLAYQKSKQLNDGVDHLWSLKEVQYNNINTIVTQVKQNFAINKTVQGNNYSRYERNRSQSRFDYQNNGQQGWSNSNYNNNQSSGIRGGYRSSADIGRNYNDNKNDNFNNGNGIQYNNTRNVGDTVSYSSGNHLSPPPRQY